MKTTLLAFTTLLGFLAGPLLAQEPPPAVVPGLQAGVNVQAVITRTGTEQATGPETDRRFQAKFDIDRLNTHDFIKFLNDRHDLVPGGAGGWKLVAVIPEAHEGNADYRFYLIKEGQTPVLVPADALSISVLATAHEYRETYNGDTLLSGNGRYKYAIDLTGSGIDARGTARGTYNVRNATIDGEAHTLVIPSAFHVSAAGVLTENAGTEDETHAVIELRFTFSASKPVNLADYPVPAPTGLTATAVSATQIDLSWTESVGATSYNVKRAAVSGGPYTTIASDVTATTYSDTGLTASTTYYYVVSSMSAAGESADSAEASATTLAAP